MEPCRVSIIVPTYREAENLPRLAPLIAQAVEAQGWQWELIVVDDNSPDGTPAVLADLAQLQPNLRYQIRQGQRGLSSAVLAGFAMARYEYLLVMDADLSHPPESIPALLEPLRAERADFVIGSRYVSGGRTESWGLFRRLNSATATWLSRPLIGGVRDSMAGFFALPRAALAQADDLNPIGYKIALELMVKCRLRRVAEVPIVFRNRTYGQSKLTLYEQFRYLEHLSRLYDYRFPVGSPRVKFLIAAGCGALAGGIAVWSLARWTILPLGGSLAAGFAAMTLVTLAFFIRYVRTQRAFIVMKRPYTEFAAVSSMEMLAGWTIAWSLGQWIGAAAWGAGVAAAVIVRYVLRKVFQHDLRGIRRRTI